MIGNINDLLVGNKKKEYNFSNLLLGKKRLKDKDFDGVPNIFDCVPSNPKLHGTGQLTTRELQQIKTGRAEIIEPPQEEKLILSSKETEKIIKEGKSIEAQKQIKILDEEIRKYEEKEKQARLNVSRYTGERAERADRDVGRWQQYQSYLKQAKRYATGDYRIEDIKAWAYDNAEGKVTRWESKKTFKTKLIKEMKKEGYEPVYDQPKNIVNRQLVGFEKEIVLPQKKTEIIKTDYTKPKEELLVSTKQGIKKESELDLKNIIKPKKTILTPYLKRTPPPESIGVWNPEYEKQYYEKGSFFVAKEVAGEIFEDIKSWLKNEKRTEDKQMSEIFSGYGKRVSELPSPQIKRGTISSTESPFYTYGELQSRQDIDTQIKIEKIKTKYVKEITTEKEKITKKLDEGKIDLEQANKDLEKELEKIGKKIEKDVNKIKTPSRYYEKGETTGQKVPELFKLGSEVGSLFVPPVAVGLGTFKASESEKRGTVIMENGIIPRYPDVKIPLSETLEYSSLIVGGALSSFSSLRKIETGEVEREIIKIGKKPYPSGSVFLKRNEDGISTIMGEVSEGMLKKEFAVSGRVLKQGKRGFIMPSGKGYEKLTGELSWNILGSPSGTKIATIQGFEIGSKGVSFPISESGKLFGTVSTGTLIPTGRTGIIFTTERAYPYLGYPSPKVRLPIRKAKRSYKKVAKEFIENYEEGGTIVKEITTSKTLKLPKDWYLSTTSKKEIGLTKVIDISDESTKFISPKSITEKTPLYKTFGDDAFNSIYKKEVKKMSKGAKLTQTQESVIDMISPMRELVEKNPLLTEKTISIIPKPPSKIPNIGLIPFGKLATEKKPSMVGGEGIHDLVAGTKEIAKVKPPIDTFESITYDLPITGTRKRIDTQIGTKGLIFDSQINPLKLGTMNKLKTDTEIDLSIKPRVEGKTESPVKDRLKEDVILNLSMPSKQVTRQITEQTEIGFGFITPTITPPNLIPEIGGGLGGGFSFFFPEEAKEDSEKGGYDAQIYVDATKKQKARWKTLNKNPLTKRSALSLSAKEVDNTISARGRVVKSKSKKRPINTGEDYFSSNKNKFRTFKQKKGVRTRLPNSFIEKQKFRLDSAGEVKKIQKEKISNFFGF